METVATILYARLHNVLPTCNSMPPNLSAGFAHELREVLETPIAKQNGLIAQRRPDSILAIFNNGPGETPDHARRALHAAVLAVYQAAILNTRLAKALPKDAPPRLALAAGVHSGKVEIGPAAPGNSGVVRAAGEAVEVARVLECTAPDIGWSIVTSSHTWRAAAERVQTGRFGSVALPDESFVDIAEVTGLLRLKESRNPQSKYQEISDAIARNQRMHEPQFDVTNTAAQMAASGVRHFSIEGYRILRKIGEGGMASIYLAAGPDGLLQVLKVMRISDDPGDPLQRFMQEFALLAQTKHPNVAQIHRQGFCAGHAYIAMEYFSEGDLRKRIGAGFDAPTAISYLTQTAAALDAIHAVGIVHRDLKPANLMLRKDGSLALVDFGIAKHVSMRLTETSHDEVVGTPYYLSPEQALGKPVDARCDLYSLGVIFYEMLTGTPPYRAASPEALLDLHINAPVPRLPAPHEGLQSVLERLMAKDREVRYSGARELLADLTKLGR